jgi:hypothetical protein
MVSFMALPLCYRENSPLTPDAPQSLSGRYGGRKNALTLPGIETTFISHTDRSLVAIPTELSRLLTQRGCESVNWIHLAQGSVL